jgi:hypothetical protein
VIVGAGPISSASGEPPCAAQHGPHTTERNTVARGRPTRTRHVTHSSPTIGPAHGRAGKDEMHGAWLPVGVSSPGNRGPRRGSPGMVTPACSGHQKPTRRTRLFRAVADENEVLALCDWERERPDSCRGVFLMR